MSDETLDEALKNLSYQDYLALWEGLFGDEVEVDRTGMLWGNTYTYTLTKLDEAQFNEHLRGLRLAYQEYGSAMDRKDFDEAERALWRATPHEIALLS